MKQKEQLENIKELLNAIGNSLSEIEQGGNVAFFKSLIQKKSIEIYENISKIDQAVEKDKTSSSKIKIISQAELLTKPEEAVKEAPAVEVESIKPPITQKDPEPPKADTKPIEVVKPITIIEKPQPEPIPVVQSPEKTLEPVAQKTTPKPLNAKKEEIEDDDSLNARLSKNIKPVVNIVEKSKETPISDMVKAISISKKFEFIKVLFNGNAEAYKNAIDTVQNAGSLQDALSYIQSEVEIHYDWSGEEGEPLANEFKSLIKRRHMK